MVKTVTTCPTCKGTRYITFVKGHGERALVIKRKCGMCKGEGVIKTQVK